MWMKGSYYMLNLTSHPSTLKCGQHYGIITLTTQNETHILSKTPVGTKSVNWKLTAICLLQTLFEQVWAANDYEIFKRMMIQKNLELQLQALEMIQQRYGITPQSYLPTDGDERLQTDEESQIMEEVIK